MLNPYQKPVMMPTSPAPQGPQLPWMPMEDDQQQQQDAGALGGGIASLLKRFQRPAGFGGGTPGGTDIGRSINLPGFSGAGL